MSARISSLTPGILVRTGAATVSIEATQGRLSLRAGGADLAAVGVALGVTLPERIGQRAAAGSVEVLALGPDEWVILVPESQVAGLIAACHAIQADHPHSLVDISGREVTVLIEGPRAAELLTLGCPRDIDGIGVGEGRRTLFDGATVVLWRDADDRFRMDIWNSFAGHLGHLLDTGARELAAEPA